MADDGNNDWLAEYRKRAGFEKKQDAFAKAVGQRDYSRIRKWCKYKSTPEEQTFTKLSSALCGMDVEVTAEELKEAYARGFQIHKLNLLKQKPVDSTLIANALDACSLQLGCDNYQAAAEKVIGCLKDETQLSAPLNKTAQQPIQKAIAASQTGQQLQNIRYLIAAIALSALVPVGEWKIGRELRVQGVTRAWALRIVIDDHNRRNVADYDQKMIMTAIEAKTMTQLDNASTRSVVIPHTKADPEDLWGRLHEIVENLVEAVNFTSAIGKCPALDDEENHQAFKAYCEELNLHLGNTNQDSEHVFNYAVNKQPGNVTNELLLLLPNMRLFICREGETALPILRVPERELEAWIANMLIKIKQRQEALKHRSSTENRSKERPMESKNRDSISITVHNTGGDSSVSVAASGGVSHQQINATQKLGNTLHEILKSTDAGNPHHEDLRFDVEGMLAKEKAGEPLPGSGRKRLEGHYKTLKEIVGTSDTVVKLISKAVDIWDKATGVIT
ncbi:hypothetical protein [endosymbiont of Lamellibrachia barhami]|uniref:hypothetical protein n=1 Tax=endosymbiont of Lamellibrachia barhami TaxID=205975 RepID=UPI0015AFFC2F|nr:hypothetical protein [endosymbiont of Lamellibrachia barhami]